MSPRGIIVVPAYNEEDTIVQVLLGLRREAPDFDLVVVNDGSTDATADLVRGLGEKQLRLVSNLGYGMALQTGLRYALIRGYKVMVSFDADGQHRSEDVPRLVMALSSRNLDMVIGSRFLPGSPYFSSFSRRLGQFTFSHLTRILTGRRIYDTTSGFKAFHAGTCQAILSGTSWDFHIETIVRLSLLGYRIGEVPIIAGERVSGRSMHSITSIVEYPLKTLLLTMLAAVDVYLTRRAQ